VFAPALLSVVLACKSPPATQTTAEAPVASLSAVPVVAQPPAEEKRDSASFAMFNGSKLVTCYEFTMSAANLAKAIAEFGAKSDAGPTAPTKLSQTCASLGQAALATCTHSGPGGSIAANYYDATHPDKYMASCVKGGGQWQSNHSPEAEMSRSQQELEALQHHQGQ
jgi:hypothetical protein